MKLLKYCLALTLFIIAFNNVHAQQRELSVNFTFPPPTSADSGQAEFLYLTLRNVDTATYTGSYVYAYTINGGPQQFAFPGNSSGLSHSFASETIAVGDSVIDTLSISPNAPQFLAGPSVVVIWPVRQASGDFIAVVDTARFTIEIIHHTDTTGSTDTISTDISEASEGRFYYTSGRIHYENEYGIGLKHVRITTPQGAIVLDTQAMNEQYIDIPRLPAGMYIAEAVLSNNKRTGFKFIASLH